MTHHWVNMKYMTGQSVPGDALLVNGLDINGLPCRWVRVNGDHLDFNPAVNPDVNLGFSVESSHFHAYMYTTSKGETFITGRVDEETLLKIAAMLYKIKAQAVDGFPAAYWVGKIMAGDDPGVLDNSKFTTEFNAVVVTNYTEFNAVVVSNYYGGNPWSVGEDYTALSKALMSKFPAAKTEMQCPWTQEEDTDPITVMGMSGWPVAEIKGGVHIVTCGHRESVSKLIVHLNDRHQWPREAIADWLETLDLDLTVPVPTNPDPNPGAEPEGSA